MMVVVVGVRFYLSEVKTVEVERKIPTQKRPRAVKMNDVSFMSLQKKILQRLRNVFKRAWRFQFSMD